MKYLVFFLITISFCSSCAVNKVKLNTFRYGLTERFLYGDVEKVVEKGVKGPYFIVEGTTLATIVNSEGLPELDTFISFDGDTLYQYNYYYDANGFLEQVVTRHPSSKSVYYLENIKSYPDLLDWFACENINGLVLNYDSQWNITSKKTNEGQLWEYENNGKNIIRRKDPHGILQDLAIYYNWKRNKLISYQYNDKVRFAIMGTPSFTYDKKGNKIKFIWPIKTGGTYLESDFRYDKKGNCVYQRTYIYLNEKVTETRYEYEYEYDRQGNWIVRRKYSGSGTGEPDEVHERKITYRKR